jgi:hypothetical protein
MVERKRNYNKLREEFGVLGSVGIVYYTDALCTTILNKKRVYNVIIDKTPSCSCMYIDNP